MKRLSSKEWQNFAKNLLKFTAPVLTIFFAQLAMGVEIKKAGLVGLYALYALVSDYLSKIK